MYDPFDLCVGLSLSLLLTFNYLIPQWALNKVLKLKTLPWGFHVDENGELGIFVIVSTELCSGFQNLKLPLFLFFSVFSIYSDSFLANEKVPKIFFEPAILKFSAKLGCHYFVLDWNLEFWMFLKIFH